MTFNKITYNNLKLISDKKELSQISKKSKDKKLKEESQRWISQLVTDAKMKSPRCITISFNTHLSYNDLLKQLNIFFRNSYKEYFRQKYNYTHPHRNWFQKFYNEFPKCYGTREEGANNENTHVHCIIDMNNDLLDCFNYALTKLKSSQTDKRIFVHVTMDYGREDNTSSSLYSWITYITKNIETDIDYPLITLEVIIVKKDMESR